MRYLIAILALLSMYLLFIAVALGNLATIPR